MYPLYNQVHLLGVRLIFGQDKQWHILVESSAKF